MSFSTILEVAIGLMLIYYALGLIVNVITRMIKDFLDLRARALEGILKDILNQGMFLFSVPPVSDLVSKLDAGQVPDQWREEFGSKERKISPNARVTVQKKGEKWLINDGDKVYTAVNVKEEPEKAQVLKVYRELFEDLKSHPLIENLKPMRSKVLLWRGPIGDPKAPEIPSDTFSLALLEILDSKKDLLTDAAWDALTKLKEEIEKKEKVGQASPDEELLLGVLKGLLQGNREDLISRASVAIAKLPDGNAKKSLQELIALFTDTPENQLKRIREGVQGLPEGSKARETLLSLLDLGVKDIAAAQKKIEKWYDDSMKKVSDLYARNVRLVVIFLAFLVTFGLGVDSITVGKALWKLPERQEALDELSELLKFGREGVPEDLTEEQIANLSSDDIVKRVQENYATLTSVLNEIERLDVPVTWEKGWGPFNRANWRPPDDLTTSKTLWVLSKILGLVITSLAVSQGSSFWYDALKKLKPMPSTSGGETQSASSQGDTTGATA
jgi:hypothetical protein